MANNEDNKNTFITETTKHIWLLSGGGSDLSKLDFSALNFQLLKIDSEELFEVIEKTESSQFENHNKQLFEGFRDKNLNNRHVYALIPIDLTKSSDKYWLVEMLLLVMFPSDIKIYAEIKFQFFDNKNLHWILSSEYTMRFTGEAYDDNFLHYPTSKLVEINEFINIFIDRYEKIPYLKTTVSQAT